MPEPLTKITIRLPLSLVKASKIYAVKTEQDLQDVVKAALVQFLSRKGGQ